MKDDEWVYTETFILPYRASKLGLSAFLVGTNVFLWSIVSLLAEHGLSDYTLRLITTYIKYTFGYYNIPRRGVKFLALIARQNAYNITIPFIFYIFALKVLLNHKEPLSVAKICNVAEMMYHILPLRWGKPRVGEILPELVEKKHDMDTNA